MAHRVWIVSLLLAAGTIWAVWRWKQVHLVAVLRQYATSGATWMEQRQDAQPEVQPRSHPLSFKSPWNQTNDNTNDNGNPNHGAPFPRSTQDLALSPEHAVADVGTPAAGSRQLLIPAGASLHEKLTLLDASVSQAEAESILDASIRIDSVRICIHRDDGQAPIPPFCYPRIFEATTSYRPVLYGQDLTRGLDVRMNLQTRKREARLLQLKSDKEAQVRNRFLDPEFGLAVQRLMEEFQVEPRTDVAGLLEALQAVEEDVHDFKNGRDLFRNQHIITNLLQHLAHHPHAAVRKSLAILLGSALENNADAQKLATPLSGKASAEGNVATAAAETFDFFPVVLERLRVEQDEETRTELIFLFTSLVRGNQVALERLWRPAADQILPLFQLYVLLATPENLTSRCNIRCQRKLVHFVTDLLVHDHGEFQAAERDQLRPWCEQLQQMAVMLKEDSYRLLVSSVLEGVQAFFVNPQEAHPICTLQPAFLNWLREQHQAAVGGTAEPLWSEQIQVLTRQFKLA